MGIFPYFAQIHPDLCVTIVQPSQPNVLARLSRQHSRKQKGNRNRAKAARKLARLHTHIANIRSDTFHKATSMIVAKTKPDHERPCCIMIEDLNVSGMLKKYKLARIIADVGFYEFRRQLEYVEGSVGGPDRLKALSLRGGLGRWAGRTGSRRCPYVGGVVIWEVSLFERCCPQGAVGQGQALSLRFGVWFTVIVTGQVYARRDRLIHKEKSLPLSNS